MKGYFLSESTHVLTYGYFSIQFLLVTDMKCFLISLLSGRLLCLITQPFILCCDSTSDRSKILVKYETTSESGGNNHSSQNI